MQHFTHPRPDPPGPDLKRVADDVERTDGRLRIEKEMERVAEKLHPLLERHRVIFVVARHRCVDQEGVQVIERASKN